MLRVGLEVNFARIAFYDHYDDDDRTRLAARINRL